MTTELAPTDGRRARGDASRREVLRVAADLASVEGLDGLSIGRLAELSGRSKSSIATLFGSKEALQLAAIDTASALFRAHVVDPSRELPHGAARLLTLLTGALDYSRARVFSGGCFFAAAAADLDSKSGPVADAVRRWNLTWHDYVGRQVRAAVEAGDLAPATDDEVAQLAFELVAFVDFANTRSLLARDDRAYAMAEAGIRARLSAAGVAPAALAQSSRPVTAAGAPSSGSRRRA